MQAGMNIEQLPKTLALRNETPEHRAHRLEVMRLWREQNREKLRGYHIEYKREYRKKHYKSKLSGYHKRYYEKNRERILAQQRQSRLAKGNK